MKCAEATREELEKHVGRQVERLVEDDGAKPRDNADDRAQEQPLPGVRRVLDPVPDSNLR